MSESEFITNALHKQEQAAPDADAVMLAIRSTIAGRHRRRRTAWMGVTAVAVAAAITIPVVVVGGRTTSAELPPAGQPVPAASPVSGSSFSRPTETARSSPMSTAPSRPSPSSASSSLSSLSASSSSQLAESRPAATSGLASASSAESTSTPTTTSRKSSGAWKPSKNPLDPNNLPPGLMPAGWYYYGTKAGALTYGVTPAGADAVTVATISVKTWTGTSWSTCAGLAAKTVDDGQGASYIEIKFDATRAYFVQLSDPDFTALTSAQMETVKSIGLDLCGPDMVWNPSDAPVG